MNKRIQPATSGTVRRLALFILLMLVIAMALMLWKWAGKRGYIADMEYSFVQYLADADVFSNRSRRMLAEIEAGKAEAEQRLTRLAENMLAPREQYPAIVKLSDDEDADSKSDIRILGAAERLIVSAEQHLQMTGDIRSALASLEYAQELLQSSEILRSFASSARLAGDIEQLKILLATDISETYQDITALSAWIDDLPLAMETQLLEVNLAEKQEDVSEAGLWHRYLHEIREDLSRLVKIEKTVGPETPLLSPSQVHLLRENVRLQLTLARLALLTRDGGSFRSALKSTAGWINRYYDVRVQSVRNMVGELSRLAGADIGVQLPNLGKTLKTVHRDQLVLKGEDE